MENILVLPETAPHLTSFRIQKTRRTSTVREDQGSVLLRSTISNMQFASTLTCTMKIHIVNSGVHFSREKPSYKTVKQQRFFFNIPYLFFFLTTEYSRVANNQKSHVINEIWSAHLQIYQSQFFSLCCLTAFTNISAGITFLLSGSLVPGYPQAVWSSYRPLCRETNVINIKEKVINTLIRK